MKIKVSEKEGELNFGVFWTSLDGRFNTKWHRTYEEALLRYSHLKNLKREPTLNIRLEHPKVFEDFEIEKVMKKKNAKNTKKAK